MIRFLHWYVCNTMMRKARRRRSWIREWKLRKFPATFADERSPTSLGSVHLIWSKETETLYIQVMNRNRWSVLRWSEAFSPASNLQPLFSISLSIIIHHIRALTSEPPAIVILMENSSLLLTAQPTNRQDQSTLRRNPSGQVICLGQLKQKIRLSLLRYTYMNWNLW